VVSLACGSRRSTGARRRGKFIEGANVFGATGEVFFHSVRDSRSFTVFGKTAGCGKRDRSIVE
jgi:hypothetical protein